MQHRNSSNQLDQMADRDGYDALPSAAQQQQQQAAAAAAAAATATATISTAAAAALKKKRGTASPGGGAGAAAADTDKDVLRGRHRSAGDSRWWAAAVGAGGRFFGRASRRVAFSPPRPSASAAGPTRHLGRALLLRARRISSARPRLAVLPLLLIPLLLAAACLFFGGVGGGIDALGARARARGEARALAARLYHLAGGLAHGGRTASSANGALKDVRVSPLRPERAYRREAAASAAAGAAALSPSAAGAFLLQRQREAEEEEKEERLLRRITEECARGEDTAIWLDAARGAVVSQPLRGAPITAAAAAEWLQNSLRDAAASLASSPLAEDGHPDHHRYANRSVVRLEPPRDGASGLDPGHCPPLDVMLRAQERGAGMCADVALYVLRAGARIVPMPRTAEARRAYDAQCGRRTARLFLESMYSEFVFGADAQEEEEGGGGGGKKGGGGKGGGESGGGGKKGAPDDAAPRPRRRPSGVLHMQLLNSEHMWTRDHALHERMDAFLCKTRFCERLARAHVRMKGLRAAVWYVGHTSSDPTVGTLARAPPSSYPNVDVEEAALMAAASSAGGNGGGNGGGGKSQPPPQHQEPLSARAAAAKRRRRRLRRERAAHAELREAGAVHVKGKSGLKHTRQLLECWGGRPDFPRLVVVGRLSLEEAMAGSALLAGNVVFFPTVRGSERYASSPARKGDYEAVARLAASGGLGEEAMRLLRQQEEEERAAAAAASGKPFNATKLLPSFAAAKRLAASSARGGGASFAQIRALQSRLPLHLCVSEREGFGHYLNEARAAGALVVSTAHPPMDELVTRGTGILVKPERTVSYDEMALGAYARINAIASPRDICAAVDRALALRPGQVARRRAAARRAFEVERAEFRARLGDLAAFLRARAAEATREAVAAAGGSGGVGGAPLLVVSPHSSSSSFGN